jgi:hypothetical protein
MILPRPSETVPPGIVVRCEVTARGSHELTLVRRVTGAREKALRGRTNATASPPSLLCHLGFCFVWFGLELVSGCHMKVLCAHRMLDCLDLT